MIRIRPDLERRAQHLVARLGTISNGARVPGTRRLLIEALDIGLTELEALTTTERKPMPDPNDDNIRSYWNPGPEIHSVPVLGVPRRRRCKPGLTLLPTAVDRSRDVLVKAPTVIGGAS